MQPGKPVEETPDFGSEWRREFRAMPRRTQYAFSRGFEAAVHWVSSPNTYFA
jgi:hypothetical protein